MGEDSRWRVLRRGQDAVGEARSVLDGILSEGARRMLQEAIEVEVADYLERHATARDPETGRRLVVRNGSLPGRELLSALGPIPITQPRVRDRRDGARGAPS